ncbi:MAG: DEAD/DEAH box helicase [Deltaproteobacteria bacterium]|nr:DEAD/DEAH box helicase [Deltaproteobacteria bacterium]
MDLDLSRFPGRVIATRTIPAREAITAPIPGALHPALRETLEQRGIARLYSHQIEAFEAARAGQNVVVTTGTASGKSLAYLLPVMQSVLDDPAARTLLLFPTKALTQDQLRGVLGLVDHLATRTDLAVPRIGAGVYDGDTPPAERTRVRDRANLVLTNPDMLHSALLPNHGRRGFAHLFRNVRYIVIDELHSYRGAFGAHFANLMRRLLRICAHHGSAPQFLCSSATIANAREHAEALCHRDFALVERDGSPSAGKVVHFWQPPLAANDTRLPVTAELATLLPHLIGARHRTIAFCKSRKETEIVLKESRDKLRDVAGHDEAYLLAGYRGGYTPEERRGVERALVDGSLLGVVSTNALELGIDIGALQVVVQGGFPGTRASFWQQLGRAGRRSEIAHAVIILAVSPTDQFIAANPDWLVGQAAEHAVVDRDNLAIQLAHVRAAAAELPLGLDDAAVFPDLGEIAIVLEKAGEVREVLGSWHWTGGAFPAGEVGLRNIHNDRFKVVNRGTGTTITEMSRPQVYREAHPRAVYLHDGVQYQIETLDLVQHVATVVEVEQNFYTQPDVRTAIDVLLTQEARSVELTRACFGDVRVEDTVVGYKMLEFHNHQNLGYEALHEHLRLALETEALWLTVSEPVLAVLGQEREDALAGMVHALGACARLATMAERSDLLGTSFHFTDEDTGASATALVCYDSHPGGLGYAAKAYEQIDRVLAGAIALVEGCQCRRGCPACVGSWARDPQLIGWALRRLIEDVAVPDRIARPAPPAIARAPRIPWREVASRWPEVLARLRAARVPGADLLASLGSIERHGARLVAQVASPGLAAWLGAEAARRRLWQAIAAEVETPDDGALAIELGAEARERALRTAVKLQRRHDDLVAGRPATEAAANDKLASGYVLADGSTRPREVN